MTDWRKKRYQFRLTEEDRDIYEFIKSSGDSDSETIRKLLKFAILHIHLEMKHRKENELLYELIEMIKQMEINQQNILDHMKDGAFYAKGSEAPDNKGEDDVEVSINKSVDAVFDSFGIMK